MKKIPLFLLLFPLVPGSLWAQFFHRLAAPVVVDGAPLPNPWTGGLNAPQWSSVELDGDGKPDLYAFDRKAEVHVAFRNTGGAGEAKYEHAPQLTAHFPLCRNFVLLRDYNQDGAMDIFTSSDEASTNVGMRVFTGKLENGHLEFDQFQFSALGYSVIPIPDGGGFTRLVGGFPDYPAVDDLDGDGDLDILNIDSSTFFRVRHYQNMALEMGFTTDTFIFEVADSCWGKFEILQNQTELHLSEDPNSCAMLLAGSTAEDRDGLHGGATLCTFDGDSDGDKELLYGDILYDVIVCAKNGGSPENAWMNEQDATFPSYDFPVVMPLFPAAFHLDADNDGLRDLLVSPNDIKVSPDTENAWFYRNVQSNEFPVFEFQQKDFLSEGMLDFGTGAHPAFADVDADGLQDLVVGNASLWSTDSDMKNPYLFLFKNTGTLTAPAFELVDDNWLNFNQYDGQGGTYAFTPAFGDLDGDLDLDLLAGERFGGLFYAENTAGAGNPMTFGPLQPGWKDITVGNFSTPFIHDLNKDGLPDLLVGERSGNINFLPNIGSPGSPAFHPNEDEAPNNNFLGNISTFHPSDPTVGLSAPVVLDFGDTTWLVTGTEYGYLEAYFVNFDSLGGGAFELVSEQFGGLREGKGSRVAFADLDGDNLLDAAVGNHRGGLSLFTSPISLTGSVDAKEERPAFSFEIFPNPASGLLQVRLPETSASGGEYRLFNALGQLAEAGRLEGSSAALDVSGLQGGLYFLEIKIGRALAVRRFVKK